MTGRHLLYGQFKIICVSWAWNHSYSIENHNFFNIIVRPTKIIIRAHKNWMHVFLFKMKYFENQKFKNDQLLNFSYFDIIQWEKIKKIPLIFKPKYVITLNILQSLGRLLIILVGLTMTWYSEKMMICTRCIHATCPTCTKNIEWYLTYILACWLGAIYIYLHIL